MGITKTDYMRGMQCPRMLWLDRHHPELKVIPPEVRELFDRGNAFGDAAMGMFGPYVEVREYKPGTQWPDKPRMAKKTQELIALGTPVICEAAFMDAQGNYCAVDILRRVDDHYEMYEVKNSPHVSEQFIKDAGYQANLIRNRIGLDLREVSIVYNSGIDTDPYEIKNITEEAFRCAEWVEQNIDRLGKVKEQDEEVVCPTGIQCVLPYECFYTGFCHMKENGTLDLPRCSWCNLANPKYVSYHDNEWGVPCHDDHALYELLILEMF